MPSIRNITAPTWPTAADRLADPLRIAAFALAVLGLEAVLAHGIVGPKISHYVLLFVGLFAIAFVFRFPMATGLAFLFFTDFIFYPNFFNLHVGPVGVRPHEFALAGLLALAAIRPQRSTWGGFVGAALAFFFGMVILSAALALMSGSVALTEAWNWSRAFFPLAFFYVVIRLFPTPAQRRTLLLGGAVVAAATGVVALFVSLGAGFSKSLEAPGGQTVKSEGGFGSLARVRLPGLSAGYALFWYSAVQIAAKRHLKRIGWTVLLLGIALDIVVSFNRNMWVGIILGLLLMMIVGGAVVRYRITAATTALIGAVIVFIIFGSVASNSHVIEPILKRGATIINPTKTAGESSLQERANETEKAWATARHHLLLGVGAGVPFGVVSIQPISVGGLVIGSHAEPQLFVHDQYLYLVLLSGIPGLIAFVFFLGVPVALAWRRAPRDPAIAACGVGIAMIMVSAIVAIYFTTEDMTAVLGLLSGVIVADAKGRAAEGRPSGLIESAAAS